MKGDERGAIFSVATVEQERTSRRRLINVDFIVANFRRHERHRRGDPLLRVMRKMNSVIAADESRMKLAAGGGRQGRGDDMDDCAAIECCDLGVAGRIAGAIRRGNRWCLQGNKDEQVRETGNCADSLLVRKAITLADQAVSAVTEAAESRRDGSLAKRLAFDGYTTRRKRLVFVSKSQQCRRVHAGSQMFVHRREMRRTRNSGDLRMLRSGDNRLQNIVWSAVLPNYWANCLLIQQRLLALRVAESGLTGAQWPTECPRWS
ncbi:hypothetical protein [Bradyrhizobium sp. STM 3557]|uniref:hypothetical protein n=1 Tax=Bradyrhizobium sp. STM 3557 TaxID=578920 RepID=UPI003890B4D7